MNSHYEKFLATGIVKCIDGEIPFDIPRGWEWVRMSNVVSLLSGRDLEPEKYNDNGNGIPYITGASNFENSGLLINRWTDSPITISNLGDLLITCKGTIGAMAFNTIGKVHIARQVMSISSSFINLRYLKIFLSSNIYSLEAQANSMIPGISRETLLDSLTPLPPLCEQERIVAKYEQLLPKVYKYGELQSSLNKLNTDIYIQLKKAILQEAIQGKLVPQDPTEGTAEELLRQIKAEKVKLVKEGKLKKQTLTDSTIYKGDDNRYWEKLSNGTVKCIDEEIPFDIPDSWRWVRLETVVTVYGGKRVPVGDKITTSETRHKYIRVADMKNNTIKSDDTHYINESTYRKIKTYTISKDDLYITVAGTIGNVGEVPIEFDNANLTENADKLVFTTLNKRFIMFALLSECVQEQIRECTTKVGQPKLAITRIQKLLLTLPPLKEQQRIVTQIEKLFEKLQ